jgi:hypothetical protein
MKIVLTFNTWGGFAKITFLDDKIKNKKEAENKYKDKVLSFDNKSFTNPIVSVYKV